MFAVSRKRQNAAASSPVSRRRGASAVEFAVSLPILLAFVFGGIEASNAVFLQQTLTVSAYEACNVASAMSGDSNTATTRATSVLSSMGVHSATVTVTPSVTADTPMGTTIVVTCTAPLAANSVVSWCLGNITQTATVTMVRL